MLHSNLVLILGLLFGITLLVMLGQKLKIAFPVFLVVAGLIIGFIPGIPHIAIDPNLIFLIFLPPLLYEAAWFTSWKNFWEYKGAIFLMAIGLVIITSIAVAYFSVYFIPGFTLALGFVLGGIISPPDAVAASAILKNVKIKKETLALLEGESLVNDASSLIVFKFALAAVVTGNFVFHNAAIGFVLVAFGGIAIGLGIALVFYAIHRWLPTTDNIDTVLTFITPYFMYIAAEELQVSGVMAVVSGGLLLSSQSHVIFTSDSRVKTFSTWSAVTFILNGVVFILIGLALPDIVAGMEQRYSLPEAIGFGAALSLLTIVVRFAWMETTRYVTLLVNKQTRIRYQGVTWRDRLIVVLAGMRGVVSLAAALSIPLLISNTAVFPFRNFILFITFVVIFFTLVVQGLMLPWVVKVLKITGNKFKLSHDEQLSQIKIHLTEVTVKKLENDYSLQCSNNQLLGNYKAELISTLHSKKKNLEALKIGTTDKKGMTAYNTIMLDIIKAQRKEMHELKKNMELDDEIIRQEEWQLDLEEMKINSFLSNLND
ncbi:MAG: Na+/H+ antiporter [Mucilaginibacter sp.]